MYEAGLGNKNWTTSVSGKRLFSWWGWISYLVGRPCLEALFHLDKVWWVTCHCPSGWVGNLCNKLCQRYNDFSHNPCTEFSMKLDISNFLTDELSGAKVRGYITYLPFLVLFCKYTFTFSSQPCVGVPKCIQSWELTVTWRILDPTQIYDFNCRRGLDVPWCAGGSSYKPLVLLQMLKRHITDVVNSFHLFTYISNW